MYNTNEKSHISFGYQSDALLILLMFRDIGKPKIIGKRWEKRAQLVDGVRSLIRAVNLEELDDIALGQAVRRAGLSDGQARRICSIATRLSANDPDAGADLRPLFLGLHAKARELHRHEWQIPEQGSAMALQALWAACVGHGVPGAVLPPAPSGIMATLTTVPPRDRGSGGRGERTTQGHISWDDATWEVQEPGFGSWLRSWLPKRDPFL